MELVHHGSHDVGAARRAVVEEHYCERCAGEEASHDERHELLSGSEHLYEFAVGTNHHLLCSPQHDGEGADGVDGLHHELQSEHLECHGEECGVDEEVTVFNGQSGGVEDDG